MPDTADLSIYQGDDYSANINVFGPGGTTLADLTGYSAQAQIRSQSSNTAPPSSGEPAATFVATVVLPNTINITLKHDQTKALTKPQYVWDVQAIDPNGWITTLLAGQVFVTMEVTRVYSAGAVAAAVAK